MAPEIPFYVALEHREALGSAGLDSLEACLAFEGGEMVKDVVEGRQTLRFFAEPRTYYLKRVTGKGWRDVVNEARVLDRLHGAGLPVPEPAAYGTARRHGALVTVALPASRTLERLMLDEQPDADRVERVAERLADLVSRLHREGVNHRDLYVGHVLIDDDENLYLLDLGRAEARGRVPRRRVVKDLAAVHFSVPGSTAWKELREAFLRHYAGAADAGPSFDRLERAVIRKARRMRSHAERKIARGDPNIHINE
jgi:heptose I phosphotransferase